MTKKVGCCYKFGKFIYNSEKREFLCRTASSWIKILTYYLFFLATTMSLLALAVIIGLDVIKTSGVTKFQKHELSTGLTAAISLFPLINQGYPAIWFTESNKEEYQRYITEISNKLNNFEASQQLLCVNMTHSNPICMWDLSDLGPCSHHPYGYGVKKPCFYIKINKSYDFQAVPYNNTSSLPKHMPNDLKLKIVKSTKSKFWIHCEGENSWDKENINRLEYYPDQGFDSEYFSVDEKNIFMSPLIGVQFFQSKNRGILTSINCHLWSQQTEGYSTFLQIVEIVKI